MTNKEILEKWMAVQYIKGCGVPLSEKPNYARFRNEKILRPVIEAYEETRLSIVKQNCELSSNEEEAAKGIYEVPPCGSPKRKAYDEAMLRLEQMEALSEETLYLIEYEQVQPFGDKDPMLFSALMELVKE